MSFLKNISPSSSTDAELVKAYHQHRQLDILAELYQRYMELVYGVCLKYLPDGETARDAVMNIFEELVVIIPGRTGLKKLQAVLCRYKRMMEAGRGTIALQALYSVPLPAC